MRARCVSMVFAATLICAFAGAAQARATPAAPASAPSAGAGPASSPWSTMAPDVEPQFVPPPNWTAVSAGSDASIVGAWLSPIPAADGFRQNINVGRYPLDESVHDYVTDSLAQFKHVAPSLKILHRGKNDTCAGGTSEIVDLVEMAKPIPDRPAFALEVVQVLTGSTTGSIFVTSYSRLPSSPEDPEAMQAIKHMCPPS